MQQTTLVASFLEQPTCWRPLVSMAQLCPILGRLLGPFVDDNFLLNMSSFQVSMILEYHPMPVPNGLT